MICCGGKAKCRMSQNGLCPTCRQECLHPQLERRLRVKAAKRWTCGENEVLLIRYKMTERRAVDRSMAFLSQMQSLFSRSIIYAHGLDNPYMEHHARKTLVGCILSADTKGNRTRNKPIVSVRQLFQTRKEAA